MTGIFPVPKHRYSKIINSYSTNRAADSSIRASIEQVVMDISTLVTPIIRLSPLVRARLESALRSTSNPATPEQYVSAIFTFSALLIISAIFMSVISPIITVVLIAFSIYYAVTSFRDLYKLRDTIRQRVENELPRFTAYINQTMRTTSNTLVMLERYVTDNTTFKEELNRTTADIRTSNFESAILRLNSRYASEHLSMVTHGLIGLFNGDNVSHYFDMLERDLTQIEINRLRAEIKKIPGKMRGGMLIVYIAIAFIFFTPVLILIVESLGDFFK